MKKALIFGINDCRNERENPTGIETHLIAIFAAIALVVATSEKTRQGLKHDFLIYVLKLRLKSQRARKPDRD
jgi:hypothetical protein